MKKYVFIALIGSALISSAALAETTHEDIAADKGAIHKDNVAIEKQNENIAVNRKEKAAAKANDNPVDQASQSVQIGANKVAKGAKEAEKSVDKEILEHHEKNLDEGK